MLDFFVLISLPKIMVIKENLIAFINEIGLQFLEFSENNFSLHPINLLLPELKLSTITKY
ncbi:hypothetical protein [Flavobacterium sp.]|jgi:hypothetical protein|uniref:hypothetical protein n=1 Tax=Flavobacterium sp. TaxID=239 RepID=UPI0037C103F8